MANVGRNNSAEGYPWINGQPSVLEPVAINPETGFATVLVDASAMAGYPQGPIPATWPHNAFPIPTTHLHPHPPPPHFLHPHAYEMPATNDYGYMAGYDSIHAPHYDNVSPMYDPSIHLTANGSHGYCQKGPNGRNHRNSRGSSLSPKRPNNRSASLNNGTAQRRGANGTSTGGRFTPSPSSGGGSRGSSPGQTQAQPLPPQAAINPTTNTASVATGPMTPGQHVVHLHVNPGETVSLQMGGQVQVIQGPATVRMVSTGSPPVPLPVQVPPGHVLQQIVDERGTLRHVILSPAPAAAPAASHGAGTVPANGHIGVLPLATPPHPPPPPTHYGTTHNVGQSPPHFYASSPHGFGPQGYTSQYPGPSIPPNLMNHTKPHSHSQSFNMSTCTNRGASPPPHPVNLHNERAQRQFAKLRKKLENRSKQSPSNSISTGTPPSSPKKDNNNVRKLKDRNQNGKSEEADGDGMENEEVKGAQLSGVPKITELKLPQVNQITCRSATVSWFPVEAVIVDSESANASQELDISYQVFIGEKGKEAKQSHMCVGTDCILRIADLQPGSDYWVSLRALVNQVKIEEAANVEFRTEACPPSAPCAPQLQNRTRNSILLRWMAPAENGSHITHYVLECDDGAREGKFSEVYRGRNKQFSIGKLQPSTSYSIRLCAYNEKGASGWSDVVNVTTMGAPPPPPSPPTLVDVSSSHLTLSWHKLPADEFYTLQISDPVSGHGFLNVYHGADSQHTCRELDRNTCYRFRLQAQNEDGISRWSEEVAFNTGSDRPAAPLRLGVKGRIHSHSFRIRWDPPGDTGGSSITKYHLEVDFGDGFSAVWEGLECEYLCDMLKPGTTYRVRISCSNSGGRSDFSEPCVVVTEPVCPSQCPVPQLVSKPRASSLQLKWDAPEFDGGAMIAQYEVSMFNPDGSSRIAYVGRDKECLVASLLPGRSYSFQVRASNRVGFGPWSELFETLSGPSVPEAPAELMLNGRSSHSVIVGWNEPPNNGSSITEFRLEMSTGDKKSLPLMSNTQMNVANEGSEENLHFTSIYCGLGLVFEVKGLLPVTSYYFRIQAVNNVGAGGYSPVSSFTTLACSPSAVFGLRCVKTEATSLSIMWNLPQSNGSPITYYNVEVGDRTVVHTCTSENVVDIENLNPDTQYRIRVQAVNAIGIGPFCPVIKCSTRPLPPAPPHIECVLAAPCSLKLRWGDGKNLDFIQYSVEMQEENEEEYFLVYEGTSHSYKVSKLKESTTYKFRICARNDVGEGPYSEVKSFTTTRAPAPTLKKPEILDLTETSCRVLWSALRSPLPMERVVYQVELIRTRDQKQILLERSFASEMFVSCLDPRTEYSLRVCPVRLCQDGEIPGNFSPFKVFSTPFYQDTSLATKNTNSVQIKEKMRKTMTDQHLAVLIIIAFTAFATLVAVILKQLLVS